MPPGTHEPLVTTEIWTAVQKKLDARNQRGSSPWVHDHYLKGLLSCSCGRRTSFQVSKGHGYFYCLGKSCSEPYARAVVLEEEVAALYEHVTVPTELRSEIEQQLEEAITEQESRRVGTLNRLTKQLTSLASQRKKLLQLVYADAIDPPTFKDERERIDEEIAAARELTQVNTSLDEARDVIHVALDLLDTIQTSYRRASDEVRRKFNRAFLERIVVADRHVREARLGEPFRSLIEVPTSPIQWR